MFEKELNKAIIVLIIFTLLFSLSGYYLNFWGHSSDEQTHRQMALDENVDTKYPALLRSVSWLFAPNDFIWVTFIMFLFAFLLPLLLVYVTKTWWVALFYFATTNLFYWTIQGGFAQTLALMFVISFYVFKDNRIRIILLFFGLASHSTAPLLLPSILLLILLRENWGTIKEDLKHTTLGLVGCTSLLGKGTIEDKKSILNQQLIEIQPNTSWWTWITPWSLLVLFFKITPLFFLIPAIKKLWQKGYWDLILIIPICFIAAFILGTRVWYLIPIPMLIGFTWYWQGLTSQKTRRFWLALVLGYLAFQLYMWINFNLNC